MLIFEDDYTKITKIPLNYQIEFKKTLRSKIDPSCDRLNYITTENTDDKEAIEITKNWMSENWRETTKKEQELADMSRLRMKHHINA